MKACIFVDGENFRHSIVKLFPPAQFNFKQEDYLPKKANWSNLYDWIVGQVIENGERIRTYWYVIGAVDYYPYGLPNPDELRTRTETQNQLRSILSNHPAYHRRLRALEGTACNAQMADIVESLLKQQQIFQRRFDGWIKVQDGIASHHKAIEFRRAGAVRYMLCTRDLGKEKAVDIKLASDMITLKDIYDVAIIVSGDQDYVPAVQVLKDYGKRVVNVAFKTRRGDLLPGGARRLHQVTDWSLDIPFDDLVEHLNVGQLPLSMSP